MHRNSPKSSFRLTIHRSQIRSRLTQRSGGRRAQQSRPLLVLLLLGHLVLQLHQLLRQRQHQHLRTLQMRLQAAQLNLLFARIHRRQRHGAQPRKPVQHAGLHHRVHIALGPREFGRILHLHQHDKVQIVPHVVLGLDVLLEANGFVVERRSIEAAHEAGVLQDQLLLLLFATQIGERVDDDAEN